MDNLDEHILRQDRQMDNLFGKTTLVNERRNGLMPAPAYEQHKHLFHERKQIRSGDILELEPDFYLGTGLLNHPTQPDKPTDWFSNINVVDGGDGRREITILDNFDGKLYKRTIHTGGDPTSGTGDWMEYRGIVGLWSGDSDLKNPVTLAHSIYHDDGKTPRFRNILVQFQTTTGNSGFGWGSDKGVAINTTNNANDDGTSIADIIESFVKFTSGNTAVMDYNIITNLFTKGDDITHFQRLTGTVRIKHIIGVI